MRRFNKFCVLYDIYDPFPVTEKLMCYFATSLANDGLAPQTIKCYLSAVRSMQISLGLPPPSEHSSLPVLKRVLDGIRRCKVLGGKPPRTRLPITTTVLRRIEAPLKECNAQDASAIWAIAVTAFFGFFRLGELLVETESDYNPALHLSWGDVAVDAHSEASMVKIHLKKSKCDQFGTGADILLGRTGCPLCPVAAILSFIGSRRDTAGCFFIDNEKKNPLQNLVLCQGFGTLCRRLVMRKSSLLGTASGLGQQLARRWRE